MPATCVVGLQWGDEAKGKIVDLLSDDHDFVVRYNGGANAGHTVVWGDRTFKLSLLPTGVLKPRVKSVIGNGLVVYPPRFLEEVDQLLAAGIPVGDNLVVSDHAHVIFPYHMEEERLAESSTEGGVIGTTGRGIGPCYQDKVARVGVRVQDLLDEKIFRQKVAAALEVKNQILVKVYNRKALDADRVADEVLAAGENFAHRIADTRLQLNKALERGETVLLEGSQGTLLDVDHGTYPFVTSSNPTSGGASVGSGIGPGRITTVLGILKAYTTRVGSGPFPSELHDEMGERLRKTGGEFGVTTGRSRRTGWFDAVIARYAARVNGITDYFLTKLDVLSGLDTVPVCVGYEVDGRRVDDMPMTQTDLHHAVPVYEELPGWWEDLSDCRTFEDLPAKARDYVHRLEELAGARISAIGVGPRRDQTIVRHDLAP
jgi:adenylosuccinate synthase